MGKCLNFVGRSREMFRALTPLQKQCAFGVFKHRARELIHHFPSVIHFCKTLSPTCRPSVGTHYYVSFPHIFSQYSPHPAANTNLKHSPFSQLQHPALAEVAQLYSLWSMASPTCRLLNGDVSVICIFAWKCVCPPWC